MMLTSDHVGISGGGTCSHVVPLSREKWISPPSDPVHNTARCSGDSAKAKIVQYQSMPLLSIVTGPPDGSCFALSLRVRSGLMIAQLFPPFVERWTNCEVM